ncbi:AAA family ATPase [Kribbella sp. NPDC050820]|uniref:AAA family ATPase n=1 Tax=Kribbella sp. NPDC050820 TaxID=3155408 RepID=UPI0033F9ACF4
MGEQGGFGETAGSVDSGQGRMKWEFIRRLLNDWEDLADVLGVSLADRYRFERGNQPRRLWEHLERRGELSKLPEALRDIGRADLIDLLSYDGTPADDRRPVRGGPAPIDRKSESSRLRAALLGGDKQVILVRGETGIGKSELVDFVVDELEHEQPAGGIRIRSHQLGPGARLTTAAIVEDIEGAAAGTLKLKRGESLTARLQLALEQSLGERVAIVVDGAQYLLAGDTRTVPLDLDEALQVLSEQRGHNVRVVLVSTTFLEPGPGTRWKTEVVPLDGLPAEHFVALVRELDRDDVSGLAGHPDDVLKDLGDLLHGNPRQLKVLNALLSMGTGISLGELTEQLRLVSPSQLERRLTDQLVATLKEEQRDVLEAVSLFTVPVPPAVVSSMLGPRGTPEIIRWLTRKHLVAQTGDGAVFLRTGEAAMVLRALAGRHTEDDPDELLRRAANALSDHRVPDREVESLADLDLHFEELRLWLESGFPEPAYARIDAIDQILQRWNRGALLLEARERVRGQLGQPFREMANCNALGDIYASQGLINEAMTAFEDALEYERSCGWPSGRRKIIGNLGSLAWEDNDPVAAEVRYADALAMAQEHGDDRDQMFALEGLANCRRWRGAYQSALGLGRKALEAAQRIGSPNAVVLATRLSRWHTEIGDWRTADRLLTVAEEEARPHRNRALYARWLDGRADFLLSQGGRETEAIEQAVTAANAALDVGDPITLMQAQTTLGAAYLENGDLVAAAREIRAAARYRRTGRSLIILVFEAILELRIDPGMARERFLELEREAVGRIGAEGHERPDFTAWDLRAVAVCGLQEGDFRATATEYFTRARCGSDLPVPGLTARLAFILEQIAQYGGAELDPVIAAATRPCGVQPLA